jgi:hypothetical protein
MAQPQQQPGTGSTLGAANPPQLLRQVFLSYPGHDVGAKDFAESVLAQALQAAGLKVMDFRDLPLKSAWPDFLVKAACCSAVTVAVLSEAYTKHFWCMLELDLALNGHTRHPRQQQPLVIPVFYDRRNDPSSMESVQELQQHWEQPDMVPSDRQPWVLPGRWAANIADMCKRLQNHRLSAFSMSTDAEWQLAQKVVAAVAPAAMVPVHVGPNMFGYEEQLSYLISLLAVGDPALHDVIGLWLYGLGKLCWACSALLLLQHARTVQCSKLNAILAKEVPKPMSQCPTPQPEATLMFCNCCCSAATGAAGGIGKTTMGELLYNQLAHRFRHSAIVRSTADSGDMLMERLSGLLTDLRCPGPQPHADITQLQSLLRTFVQGKAVLLLVDNVCSAQQLDDLLPLVSCFGPGSRVIITSRLASIPDSDQYKVGVDSCCAQHCMQQSPCCAEKSGCLCMPQKLTH